MPSDVTGLTISVPAASAPEVGLPQRPVLISPAAETTAHGRPAFGHPSNRVVQSLPSLSRSVTRGGTAVTGVYMRALGDVAADLHPKVRERYDIGPDDAVCVGRGRMDISRGTHVLPVLWLLSKRDLLFPEAGHDVPFTVTSVGYHTEDGHEALTTRRAFDFGRQQRRFDSRRCGMPTTSGCSISSDRGATSSRNCIPASRSVTATTRPRSALRHRDHRDGRDA